MNSALGYADACGGNCFRQPQCSSQIDFEGAQIAAVDSDQVASGIEGALEFGCIMSFAENVESLRPALLASETSSS